VTIFVDSDGASSGVGEIVINTPYGPRGYIGDSPGTGPFTPDGVRSGDAGWLDHHGRLHLVGRRAHQLNVRGRNVDPAEVERAFWTLDGMQDVAVVGVDRANGDQWIAAFVVCPDGITWEALERATAHLEYSKRPQRVIRLPALPKVAAGKNDVATLRAIAGSAVTVNGG
jgi:acyl-coenzyme A synthetase/AMP-(fatty) acid ligase